MMITEISVQRSSGNIFDDLGFDDPEEMLAKSEIVRNIDKTITQLQIDHARVAELIGIKESEVYDLITGKLLDLPKDQLSQFLTKLNTMNGSNHPKAQEILKLQEIVENGILSGEWTFDHEISGSGWDGYFSTKGIAKCIFRPFTVDISFVDGAGYDNASLIWKENDEPLLKADHYYREDYDDSNIDTEAKELIKTCLNIWINAKKERVTIIQNNLLSDSVSALSQPRLLNNPDKVDKEGFQSCSKLISDEYILDRKTLFFINNDFDELKEAYKGKKLNKSVTHLCNAITNQIFRYVVIADKDKSIHTLRELINSTNLELVENLDTPEKWNFRQLIEVLSSLGVIDQTIVHIATIVNSYGQTEVEVIDSVPSLVVNGLNIICHKIIQWYGKTNS